MKHCARMMGHMNKKRRIPKRFTIKTARKVARMLNLNFKKKRYHIKDLLKGMNVELEHKDVTKGCPVLSAKIALAHLREHYNYYKLLEKCKL